MTNRIPFCDLQSSVKESREDLVAAAIGVIDGGSFVLGSHVRQFEEAFASFCRTKHAIGVGTGLDAISLILRGLGIGPGDEVIVPGHTFIATWLAVSLCGATPVPVDIDPVSFNIDPRLVPASITARTKAIIAVHLYGRTADVTALAEIAKKAGLALVEDAAQAHGATHAGHVAGSLGTAAAFSFYPTKNLGALGDGGGVTTSDDELARRIRRLRNYGSETKYVHEEVGTNSRLDEFQAALLSVKLERLARNNERRRALARLYGTLLCDTDSIVPPARDDNAVWHLYVIRSRRRDRLRQLLAERGVETLVHYPTPPHLQPAYVAVHGHLSLPESTRAATEVLSLPFWPEMSESIVNDVVARLRGALETMAGEVE